MLKKLAQINGILIKLRHYIPQETRFLVYFFFFYSFSLYSYLVWQFFSKTNLDRVFVLQKKCLLTITFSFSRDNSIPLFKDFKLLKLHYVLKSEFTNFSIKFLEMRCRNRYVVHEVHTRNARNNLLIYIPRMPTSQYGNHSLRGDGGSLWNKFNINSMTWYPFSNWSYFIWNNSYKLTKMNCKLQTHIQTISSQFSLLNVLLWNVVQLILLIKWFKNLF